MHRIDTEGHDDGLFQDGTPQIGQQGTVLDADWLNDVQENVCTVVEAGYDEEGEPLVLAKGEHGQLLQAIESLIALAASGAQAAARVRPGIIEMFGGAVAPAGYLECDGAVVSRVTYADLFAAIGETHGAGDGATTFALPDLRGEFARGWDHGRGVDVGRGLGTAQAQSFPVPALSSGAIGSGLRYDPEADGSDAGMSVGSGGQPVTPRNVALMFVIKT